MEFSPYTCSGLEAHSAVELLDAAGNFINAIESSRCFADWYCAGMGYTWRWRNGVGPDDPTTWPVEPEEQPEISS
jgi:hypothetical protein